MSGLQELEKYAVKYATEAVNFDRQGAKSLAISKYQKAVEILLKICSLYPNTPKTKVYMEHVES
ncbi:MAG: AAA family ATPase, partial [Candidatus Hecatellales archaeon]